MYAGGEAAMKDDTVKGSGGQGVVLEVTPNGVGGEETATVKWTTPRSKASGINAPLATSTVPTRTLTLVRRKTA
jgi:hypothetical protein